MKEELFKKLRVYFVVAITIFFVVLSCVILNAFIKSQKNNVSSSSTIQQSGKYVPIDKGASFSQF